MKTLICGPMYSGKSTALFQRLERLLFAKKQVMLIRPKKDDRGYFTHSEGIDIDRLAEVYKGQLEVQYIKECDSEFLSYIQKGAFDAVFVDEYFMIPGIHQLCFQTGYDVFFGGLLASSECGLFEETVKILPYCDKIKKLNAVCMNCGSELANYSFADFNKTSSIVVGDSKYKCLCQKCYIRAEEQKNLSAGY